MEGTFELGCRGCWTVGLGWAVLFVVVLVGLVADMAEIEVVVRIEGAVRIEDTAGVVNMVVEVDILLRFVAVDIDSDRVVLAAKDHPVDMVNQGVVQWLEIWLVDSPCDRLGSVCVREDHPDMVFEAILLENIVVAEYSAHSVLA